jgi:hypothetical protein
MSLSWFVLLQYGEVFFNVIFTIEALAKITSSGFVRYIVQPVNTFDFTLVLVSDLLMVLQSIGTKLPNVSFFRALRILRAFRMITRFHRLRLLFRRSAASLQTVLVVIVLLFVFLSAFAIVGMKIFQCEIPTCEQDKETGACLDPFAQCINSLECPLYSEEISGTAACPFDLRRNFNTFHNGLISMFVIFTGERWTDIMIDGMRSQSVGFLKSSAAIFFFASSYFFFNLVLANLFIAVLLDNFSTSEKVKMDLQEKSFKKTMFAMLKKRTQAGSMEEETQTFLLQKKKICYLS